MPTAVTISPITLLLMLGLGLPLHSQACDKRAPTADTGPGPHDYSGAPAESELWRNGDDGVPLLLHARVLDTCGKPVAGARIQILHANQDGEHEPDRWRADLTSDERGEFKLITVFPGYAGSIARHIHFIITHPRHRQLITRLFFKNDPAVSPEIEDLAIVLEEIRRGENTLWVGGYEFVLAPG